MRKIVDLTHVLIDSMPVCDSDDSVLLKKVRTLSKHEYNDWQIISGMHVGTHIDGPGHLMESDKFMSDIPLDRFIGDGYLIDAANKSIDSGLLKNMPRQEELIVLIYTGFDKKFGTEEYYNKHPLIPEEFAYELVRRKVKMVGIDFFSPDQHPFDVHKIFLKHDILIIENLIHLEALRTIQKFKVIALPLKTATDSALARVIAIVE